MVNERTNERGNEGMRERMNEGASQEAIQGGGGVRELGGKGEW